MAKESKYFIRFTPGGRGDEEDGHQSRLRGNNNWKRPKTEVLE